MPTKFEKSVAKMKRERFREYSKTNYEWPNEALEQQFDLAIKGLKDKRDTAYAERIVKRYPQEFVGKVVEWVRGLSDLEGNSYKSFEDAAAQYIHENPGKVTSKEIGLFFDGSGNPKRFVESPDDMELSLDNIAVDEEGNLYEKPPIPQPKTAPNVPTREQAKNMTSAEIAKFLPTQSED